MISFRLSRSLIDKTLTKKTYCTEHLHNSNRNLYPRRTRTRIDKMYSFHSNKPAVRANLLKMIIFLGSFLLATAATDASSVSVSLPYIYISSIFFIFIVINFHIIYSLKALLPWMENLLCLAFVTLD